MTASLRVLMVSDASPLVVGSGGERVLWEQASRLVGRGHQVRILGRSPAGEPMETLERQGVQIRHFAVDRGSLVRFIRSAVLGARRAAAAELSERGADVLHVHHPLSGYGVLRSRAAHRIPSLYTFHSPAPLEYRSRQGTTGYHRSGWSGTLGMALLWLIERACLKRATRIHVLSDFSAGLLRRLYRIPSERVTRIPGGVDTVRFQPADHPGAVRKALGIPTKLPLFFTLRNLESRMGLDALIRAMGMMRREVPEFLLWIGGVGPIQEELESLSASLDLRGHVRFLGYVPEEQLPLYYQAADCFVLPTRELEGFGLVTVEALACGTPVLGTPVGATPEILSPLAPELLTRDASPEALADGLRRVAPLLGDPAFRARCRAHAVRHYGWPSVVGRLEQVLMDLVDGVGH